MAFRQPSSPGSSDSPHTTQEGALPFPARPAPAYLSNPAPPAHLAEPSHPHFLPSQHAKLFPSSPAWSLPMLQGLFWKAPLRLWSPHPPSSSLARSCAPWLSKRSLHNAGGPRDTLTGLLSQTISRQVPYTQRFTGENASCSTVPPLLLYFSRYCESKDGFCLLFMYYLCEEYYKPSTEQYSISNCVSGAPRPTLLDLRKKLDLRVFPDSSAGKESACNAGDPSPIPGLGRSSGEGNGYLLQHSGLENSRTEEPGRLQSMGVQRVRHD